MLYKMIIICVVCKRKILQYCKYMRCAACKSSLHLKCIPKLTKEDSLYTNRNNNDWICTVCIEDALPFNHLVDENDFFSCFSTDKLPGQNISLRDLNNSVSFMPFELSDDKLSDKLHDIDPDTHFYRSLPNILSCSKYYDEVTFVDKCSQLKITENNFSLFHVNARSIPKHHNDLKAYLSCLGIDFTILGFSETWFNASNVDLYGFDGYAHIFKHRNDSDFPGKSKGGGVSLFIKQHIEFNIREDISTFT